jgi:hypothetical protein
LTAFETFVEFHIALNSCKDGVIFAHSNTFTRPKLRTALAHNDVAWELRPDHHRVLHPSDVPLSRDRYGMNHLLFYVPSVITPYQLLVFSPLAS